MLLLKGNAYGVSGEEKKKYPVGVSSYIEDDENKQ